MYSPQIKSVNNAECKNAAFEKQCQLSCIYKNCKNKDKVAQQNLKFFKVPKHERRCRQWLQACGRTDLLDISATKCNAIYHVCSTHFEPTMYTNPTEKTELLSTAEPVPFRDGTSDSDPLAITSANSLSLFGDSVNNIEFIVENDEDVIEYGIGTKENPIVVHVTGAEGSKDQSILNKNFFVDYTVSDDECQVIDLDSSEMDSKEEITIEEAVIQAIPDETDINSDEITNTSDEKDQTGSATKLNNLRCYVPNCTIDQKDMDKVIWFQVPKDENVMKLWDICINRQDKRLVAADLICDQHFNDRDIIYNVDSATGIVLDATLKHGAVPCVKYHEECCVPNCVSKTGNMFAFPIENAYNYRLWLYMVRNPALKNLAINEIVRYRVCSRHFESDCFDQDNKLKPTTAPTLHLPDFNVSASNIEEVRQPGLKAVSTTDPLITCASKGCTNSNLAGKKIFRFPFNYERCVAWMKFCHKRQLTSSPIETVNRLGFGNQGLCEDHFEKKSFEDDGTLKSDAVPIIYSAKSKNQPAVSVSAPTSIQTVPSSNVYTKPVARLPVRQLGKTKYVNPCWYKGCNHEVSIDNPLFNFPTDPERAGQWLKACGQAEMSAISTKDIIKYQRICSKHFDESMFYWKNRLKTDATPIPYGESRCAPTILKTVQCEKNKQFVPATIRCAVSTCPNTFNRLPDNGKFPDPEKDPARFSIWMELVDNKELRDLTPKEVCEKFMVCLRHFEEGFYMENGTVGMLSEDAVPTKHLTDDIEWLHLTDYYKDRLQKYLDSPDFDSLKSNTIDAKPKESEKNKGDSSTVCVLQEDGIHFPKTGQYLYMEKKPDSKRPFPYNVYKYCSSGYGLNNGVTAGETVKIHTAIIIDDDDECEKRVIQYLLDKRRKY